MRHDGGLIRSRHESRLPRPAPFIPGPKRLSRHRRRAGGARRRRLRQGARDAAGARGQGRSRPLARHAPRPRTRRPTTGIAWKEAASDSEIDAAFAAAKSENKPVFVYWGAKWCPPCNQVKATLFNRQDFIERSRSFVPVYVDGDSPGAQKIGARFHVSGYPTMVLFNPQGKEVTRLPGEVDAVRYSEVLTLGMNASRPVSAVLADALATPAALGANDWRLLAFYSWDTDHQQVIAKEQACRRPCWRSPMPAPPPRPRAQCGCA